VDPGDSTPSNLFGVVPKLGPVQLASVCHAPFPDSSIAMADRPMSTSRLVELASSGMPNLRASTKRPHTFFPVQAGALHFLLCQGLTILTIAASLPPIPSKMSVLCAVPSKNQQLLSEKHRAPISIFVIGVAPAAETSALLGLINF